MSDSPTLGAVNQTIGRSTQASQKGPGIATTDLQAYILAFWTSLPPLVDTNSSPAEAPDNQSNHYDPSELVKFYDAFVKDCKGKRSHISDAFKDTLKRTKHYPWKVKELPKAQAHDAGYAWYKALALAALEVEEFSSAEEKKKRKGQKKEEAVEERLVKAKERVMEVIRGQRIYLDSAFNDAKGVALKKPD